MLRSDIRRAHLRASTSDRQPDLEHRQKVRELLAALAEIDHAYQVDLETVRTSDAPIMIKQTVLNNMRQRHQVRRAPYLHELETLQNQWRGDRRGSLRTRKVVTRLSLAIWYRCRQHLAGLISR